MISAMTSVEVVGPLRLFDTALTNIQEAAALHLEEIPLAEDGGPGPVHRIHLSPAQEEERTALEDLVRLLSDSTSHVPLAVRQRLEGSGRVIQEYRRWEAQSISSMTASARVLHSKVRSFVRRERNLEDDVRLLTEYEEVAAALAPLVESSEMPKSYEFIGVIFERNARIARDVLKREMARLTGGRYYYVETHQKGGRAVGLLGFDASTARDVRFFVAKAGIAEMSFPRYLRDKPFEEAFATLEEDLAALRKRRTRLRAQAERFFEESAPSLLALHRLTSDLLARYEARSMAARTDYAFVLHGWVVRSDLASFSDRLASEVSSAVIVRPIKAQDMGKPPVLLNNPRPVRSFEPLLGLLPLPAYGSIDPTTFLATFFPPMFGLMLGDIGYGALLGVSAAIVALIGRGRRLFHSLAVVTALCAFYSVAFGFVFGEIFGDWGHSLGLHPLWRERLTMGGGAGNGPVLMSYLVISVAIGLLHIILGIVLGMISAHRRRDHGQLLGLVGRMVGLIVLFLLVASLAHLLPPQLNSAWIGALVVFLAIMVYHAFHDPVHGLLMPLEVISTVGNILSYARIMAIGVASVVLALLANMFAGMSGSIVLAAVVVILVHALNLVLGIIDPTIQGLRLHYVEFFSKFYVGGGRRFSPLSKMGGVLA